MNTLGKEFLARTGPAVNKHVGINAAETAGLFHGRLYGFSDPDNILEGVSGCMTFPVHFFADVDLGFLNLPDTPQGDYCSDLFRLVDNRVLVCRETLPFIQKNFIPETAGTQNKAVQIAFPKELAYLFSDAVVSLYSQHLFAGGVHYAQTSFTVDNENPFRGTIQNRFVAGGFFLFHPADPGDPLGFRNCLPDSQASGPEHYMGNPLLLGMFADHSAADHDTCFGVCHQFEHGGYFPGSLFGEEYRCQSAAEKVVEVFHLKHDIPGSHDDRFTLRIEFAALLETTDNIVPCNRKLNHRNGVLVFQENLGGVSPGNDDIPVYLQLAYAVMIVLNQYLQLIYLLFRVRRMNLFVVLFKGFREKSSQFPVRGYHRYPDHSYSRYAARLILSIFVPGHKVQSPSGFCKIPHGVHAMLESVKINYSRMQE